MRTIPDRLRALAEWWRATRPGRAMTEFSARGGSLLASGIAYSALFSLFAAAAIGFTVLLWIVGSNHELLDAVTRTINDQLPGLIATDGGKGLLDPNQLTLQVTWSITGVVALAVLIWSATSLVRALRSALVAITQEDAETPSLAHGLASDLGTATLLGLALLIMTGIESASLWLNGLNAGTAGVVHMLGAAAIWLVTFLLGVVVSAGVMLYLYRVVARVEARPRDLMLAAIGVGVSFGVIRAIGVGVVAGAARNPLLASFAVVVTLLAWTNLVARIVLLGAAFAATGQAAGDPAAGEAPTGDKTADDDAAKATAAPATRPGAPRATAPRAPAGNPRSPEPGPVR